MGDVFKEQIVKRKPTIKDTAIRICLIIVVIMIFIISITYLGAFGVLITAVAGFGANYLMGFLSIEYEYVFTNGELDIDIIYSRSRRKRVFTAHVNKFDIMAPLNDTTHAHEFNRMQELRDYSSGTGNADTYAFLINKDGKYLKVLIEPNEKMMAAISGAIGRSKLHIRK